MAPYPHCRDSICKPHHEPRHSRAAHYVWAGAAPRLAGPSRNARGTGYLGREMLVLSSSRRARLRRSASDTLRASSRDAAGQAVMLPTGGRTSTPTPGEQSDARPPGRMLRCPFSTRDPQVTNRLFHWRIGPPPAPRARAGAFYAGVTTSWCAHARGPATPAASHSASRAVASASATVVPRRVCRRTARRAGRGVCCALRGRWQVL